MKQWIIFLLLTGIGHNVFSQQKQAARGEDSAQLIYRQQLPAPVGRVNDFGKVFTGSQRNTLDSIINGFEKETSVEFAIVTLDTSWVIPGDFDQFSLYVFNKWGIGKPNVNNGVLVIFSTSMRAIRIENGYGISAVFSDADTKTILDTWILTRFRDGQYFEGVRDGILQMMKRLR